MFRTALRLNLSGAMILLAACGDDGAVATTDTDASSGSSTTDDPSTSLTTSTTADTSGSSSTDDPSTTLTTADSSSTDDPSASSSTDPEESSSSTDPEESSSSTDAESSSSSGGGPVCGDGMIEGAEVCDGVDLAGQDCVLQNFDAGTLACADDCLSFNTDACINFACGNNDIEGKEVCDGADLNGQDCAAFDFDGGTLGCDANCGAFDTTGCYVCGDGQIGGPEVCDGAALDGEDCVSQGFTEGTLSCAADCSAFDQSQCTLCGDDVAEGNEICDGDDLLGSTCQTEGFDGGTLSCTADCGGLVTDACTDCGDNIIEGAEQCEGANLNGGTCNSQGAQFGTLACASDCSYDLDPCYFVTSEVEPNDDGAVAPATNDFLLANAQGPFSADVFLGGAINPVGDDDFFAITNPGPAYASLRLETFGPGGPATCVGVDTVVEIRSAANALLATNDESGVASCSLISGFTLAPGDTVYVRVIDFGDNTAIASYFLDVQITPSVCGNGVIQIGEQCDDGNGGDGDGCSSVCLAEAATQEINPNGTNGEADANGIISTGSSLFGGSIAPIGEVDRWRLDLAAPAIVRMETFTSVNDCLAGNVMDLNVFDAANTLVIADAAGLGIQECGAISFPLPAGTFYVQVSEFQNNALLPSYLLEIEDQTDTGIETEPNEDQPNADTNIQPGVNVYVFGDHTLNADSDYYAIDVPAGASLRLETIEGDRAIETCEANGVDSRITVFNPANVQINDDDDSGRGFCSLVDGTGTVPLDAPLNNLAAGTYYVQVRQAAAATVAGGQFIYRLVATVREP